MTHADAMKARLRADLLAAMKSGRSSETGLLRALVAAIDNAEAPPPRAGGSAANQHRFGDGTAEADRLSLNHLDVQTILLAEMEERMCAAVEMDRLGYADRATALRAEAAIVKRYTVDR